MEFCYNVYKDIIEPILEIEHTVFCILNCRRVAYLNLSWMKNSPFIA